LVPREDGDTLFEVYSKTRGKRFGQEVRRRIMLGTYVLSHGYYDAYYRRAINVREAIKNEFRDIFNTIDAIAMPTSPTPAFALGEKANDPLALYLADVFTVPANIVGLPAISIPNGQTKNGLPLDIQFMTSWYNDEVLFELARKFEKS
jgi:aspartyl-tRNA(Asn)/glutamyl-tRNA(Gln) amidotransferase subunit A